MIQTLKPQPVVNVADMHGDLCDRCGAAAKLRAHLGAGGTLAFCGHHANRFTDRIAASATTVDVETGFTWRGEDEAR
ncbi:MAG TPA: hypothetical protein VK453_07340 [Micromonosporaceae bacterium]|nr:hypothetical protein [Micromonosporaceae bacterium]